MYLKNDSTYQVGLKTKKRILFINPGKYEFIPDNEIIDISNRLTEITEEEYNKAIGVKSKADKKAKTEVVEEEKELKFTEVLEPTVSEESIKEEPVKETKRTRKALENTEETSSKKSGKNKKESKEDIEKRINFLKQDFINASNSKAREVLAKQIKELQKKLD